MKILILATGSRGDIQPYVALGKGLKDAGHHIRFVSHKNFQTLAEEYGLEFWSVDSDTRVIAESEEIRQSAEKGNFIALMAQMAKEAQREARAFVEVGMSAGLGMDLILAGLGGAFIGAAIAEKLGLRLMQAYVVPFTPTREFSSVLTPKLPRLLNRFSHQLARQMIWQGFRSADTMTRKFLEIPAAPIAGPYNSKSTRGLPILYGFSPSVIPTPSDWDENIHVTGYWFADEADGWTPPPALTNFLQAGPPPVYIGFGSMNNRDPKKTADLVVHAVQQANQRAILLSGWGGLHKEDLPDSIFMIDSIPHAWLFPRVAAVVHHGGASTTAAGLRAGVPSIIVPFFGDQPFWGRRVAELGVGPNPIPRAKLTSERLAQALQRSLADGEMRQRASALGEKIRAEDGIANAAKVIEQIGNEILSPAS